MMDMILSLNKDSIQITIGFQALTFFTENHPELYDDENDHGLLKVTDAKKFAKAVLDELNRGEEDGTTLVHVMLDAAIFRASEQGAEGVEERG